MSTRSNRRAQAPIAGKLAGANLGGTATGDAVPTAPIPAGRLRAHRMSDALAQMDPRLQRARARQASGARKVSSASTNRDDIAVIAKVTDLDAWNALSEVTEGVRLGERENGTQIVTARIPLSRIEFVRHQPEQPLSSARPDRPERPILRGACGADCLGRAHRRESNGSEER